MRLLLLLLTLFATPPGVTLTTAPTPENWIAWSIHTDAPRQFYVEITTTGGTLLQSASFYQFGLQADESFGATIEAIKGIHAGTVHVQAWASDGGDAPIIDQSIPVPARLGVVFVPIMLN